MEPRSMKNETWCSYDSARPISHGNFMLLHFSEFDSAMDVRVHGLSQKCQIADMQQKHRNEAKIIKNEAWCSYDSARPISH